MAEKRPKPPIPKKPKIIPAGKSYGMTLPRLGHAIIINNVSQTMPGSEVDVRRLKEAYETVGFDCYVYRNCTVKELDRIRSWLVTKETHKYCNAFSLIVIGRGTDDGDLLDCHGSTFCTVEELTDVITGIQTLEGKPKLLLILRCADDAKTDVADWLNLSEGKDMFLGYSCIKSYEQAETGSEYLQAYAKYLHKDFEKKSIQDIFALVNKAMKQQAFLPNNILMEVARCVAARDMESLALGEFGLERATVTNLRDSRRTEMLMFSFDILCMWRNKSEENTKQKLSRVMSEEGERHGNIDGSKIKEILEAKPEEVLQSYKEVNGFKQALYFGDFHVTERKKIRQLEEIIKQLELNMGSEKHKYEKGLQTLRQELEYLRLTEEEKRRHLEERLRKEKEESLRKSEERVKVLEKEKENYYDYHQNEMKKLKRDHSDDKERAIKEERDKLNSFQQEKMKHEEELKNKIKMLEQEKQRKLQEVESEDKERIRELEEALLKISDDKVKFEEEMRTIRQEMKDERTQRMEAEVRMIRSLEKTVQLSAQRLLSLKTKDTNSSQVKEATEETVPDDVPAQKGDILSDLPQTFQILKEKAATAELQAKLTQSEKEKQQLEDEIREIREKEKRTKEELERKLAKLTRSENEKQQLEDEIREIREKEKRTKEELERKLIEKENEVENVTVVKEKEMSYMKQNYEEKISTLENQLKDNNLKIRILTEEKLNIEQIHQKKFQEMIIEKDTEREKLKKLLGTKINTLEDQLRNSDHENKTLKEKQDQLDRFIEKIQKEAEFKQKEALTEQLTVQQEETNKLLTEQKAKYEELEKVMAEKNEEMEKMKEATDEKIRKLEVELKRVFKEIELDHISSHDVNINLPGINDMAVMRETGLIVVSTGLRNVHQLSLQEGRLIEKEIEQPCEHSVWLLCVQVAGREYLALSCDRCRDIKLMNPKRKKGILHQFGSGSDIQYEVITAFSGEDVYCMCQGEENRLFVQSSSGNVLELDTSTTTFTRVRTINTGPGFSLCYVPDPHRLLVVSDVGRHEVRAASCDDDTVVWRVQSDDDLYPGRSLYIPGHNAILVADRCENRVVILNSLTGLQIQTITLPHNVCYIRRMCLFNDQIIVESQGDGRRISYFSPK